jgi:hypothetical protein
MQMIPRIAVAVERLLGPWAEQVNQVWQVVQRQRKFTAATLARTLVLGFLAKPDASDKELAETAACCGVEVTPQAIEQRFTPRLAQFAEGLLQQAVRVALGADTALAPLLARFTSVAILDSTTIALPNALRERFAGCGGSHGSGQAALKIQLQWDLRSGALETVRIEPGRDSDYKTPLQQATLSPAALRIADLGYFDTAVLERFSQSGVFWLSRLQFGTTVFTPQGTRLPLPSWLAERSEAILDEPVQIGIERKLPCRLLAWRVPHAVAQRRRRRLRSEATRKSGRTPSRERLAWCDWTVLVTNVPSHRLAPQEAAVLYRARWQIELLFKRWKSLGRVDELKGATLVRQIAQLWLRLLAVVVEHWVVLTAGWGDARLSLTKASQLVRRHAVLLTTVVGHQDQLQKVLQTISRVIRATARQNKRKRPSTFELLHNPALLDYALT